MPLLLLLFDTILLTTLIGLAIAAVLSAEPRSAVMLFIAFGLWLSLVWARLGAPDVALAEAAIGAGIGGALMLSAARRKVRRDSGGDPSHEPSGCDASGDPGGDPSSNPDNTAGEEAQ
ncbi:Na(+)/H(+) antiporter subunit B [Halochromatium salexigens]|uniref:MrpA C-terminal/MbhD domain-containing protein n=1 Tax=Halochromatium salexigens TaxID=49447 RepID=A0AAJ0XEA8_HALSE|nr:DUF4040 domain-containing protein [Halochromatium salexigens]MBK5929161.1 hypothetical protein [Halochromatium salexigens]